jgi:RecT family
VVIAIIKAAQLGVELENTVFKHAYLISRYNGKTKRQEIMFQLGAYGKLYLLNEYRKISAYTAVPLYEYDFVHKTFTHKVVNNREIIEHDVGATQFLPENADGSDPRGKIVGMYLIMKIEGMGEFVKVGRLTDLYKAAYDSKKYKKGNEWLAEMSFWDKHGKAMMEKTLAAQIASRIPIGGSRNSPKTEAIDLPCVNIIGTQSADESGDKSEFNDAYLIEDCFFPEEHLPQGDENEIVLPD